MTSFWESKKWESEHMRKNEQMGKWTNGKSGVVGRILLLTCTSANVIYCITCTLCKKIFIGETGRRLGDRFREHLRDIERNDKDASKPVARHFNLPNPYSSQHMTICGLSLHQGNMESRKNLEKNSFFKSQQLIPTVSTNAFHSTNLVLFFTLPCSYQ